MRLDPPLLFPCCAQSVLCVSSLCPSLLPSFPSPSLCLTAFREPWLFLPSACERKEYKCLFSGRKFLPASAFRKCCHCGPQGQASSQADSTAWQCQLLGTVPLVDKEDARLKGSWVRPLRFQRAAEARQYVAEVDSLKEGPRRPLHEDVTVESGLQ